MALDQLGPEIALALSPGSLLARFNHAGVLAAADVHVAQVLARLGGEVDEAVCLAAALAVRAPRVGHVLADLVAVRATVVAAGHHAEAPDDASDLEGRGDAGRRGHSDSEGADLETLPWPDADDWARRLASSPLVAVGDQPPGYRPLRLVGTALYLERYWRDERLVAADLLARAASAQIAVDEVLLGEGLAKLFPEDPGGLQARAASTSVRLHLSVVAGGPGTGKTTTVARILALLEAQAAANGQRPPLVALAAPTGKAAARMAEAVHAEADRLDVSPEVRERLGHLEASTVHRLLGRHPAGLNRFRHDRDNRLTHDVVVVDETSMMSLPLMARLVAAVRPDARLVLIGDPEQLASVEAGAVLADIIGPAAATPAPGVVTSGAMSEHITVLHANHRFAGPLADLALAVRQGEVDAVVGALAAVRSTEAAPVSAGSPVRWLEADLAAGVDPIARAVVRSSVLGAAKALVEVARRSDAAAALAALGQCRLLCAHRDGSAGASTWNERAEQWLESELPGRTIAGGWYAGRPVVVTENDYSLGLFNGDTGIALQREDGGLTVVFRRGASIVTVSPSRLASVATAFAMTAHRAQGSEFDDVVVLLPGTPSRVLTRELLYTAITRARRSVTIVGTEASVRWAVNRPVARASGLTARLWGAGASSQP